MTQGPTAMLWDCERERLDRIGAIQPFGVLLGGDAEDDRVRFASAGAAARLDWDGDVLGSSLGELVQLSLADFPIDPGQKSVRLGLLETREGWLDGLLTTTETGWLLELEPMGADDPPLAIANPLLHALFRAPTSADQWGGYAHSLTDAVRRTAGYDRVMVYRFLPDDCGEVVGEAVAAGPTRYLGLRFPAGDIPKIARDLYRRNSHRQIPDVGAVPEPILALPGSDPDLSLSDLRAVSPVHLKYLGNMEVAASLSFSILVGGKLWGLVACHHGRPRFLSLSVREHCLELVQAYAIGIGSYQAHQRLRALTDLDQRLARLSSLILGEPVSAGLDDLAGPMLDLVAATGAAMVDETGIHGLGLTPPAPWLAALDAWFVAHCTDDVLATDCLSAAPGQALGPQPDQAAGLLALRARTSRPGAAVRRLYWFRLEQPSTVHWAGDPNKPLTPDADTGLLNPRHSFERWVETRRGHSAAWDDYAIMAARKLRLLLVAGGKLRF